MNVIEKYLNMIQSQESIFPMDSIHSGTLPSRNVMTGDHNTEEDETIELVRKKIKGNK